MLSLEERHKQMIYPVVRIRTSKSGGSGTLIYSKEDPKNSGEYLNFVLTNSHVVFEGAIEHKKDWDSLLMKDIKKEFKSKVDVEIFDYIRVSEVNSSNTHKAEIECYDKKHDLAILKLDSPLPVKHIAKLIPREQIRDKIKLTEQVVACGCSLLHDPIPNQGTITSVKDILENKKYCLTNANIIFGNSGGSMFLSETGEFIGVPSRVTAINLGFNIDIITWMGFFCHPERLYEFFDEQLFKFIYDDSAPDYYETLKLREKEKKRALYRIKSLDEDKEEPPNLG